MIVYELILEDSADIFGSILFANREAAKAATPQLIREYVDSDGDEYEEEDYPVMGEWEGGGSDRIYAFSFSGPTIRAYITEREVRK